MKTNLVGLQLVQLSDRQQRRDPDPMTESQNPEDLLESNHKDFRRQSYS